MMARRTGLLAMVWGVALGPAAFAPKASAATPAAFAVTHTDEEWRRRLTPTQYSILREADTEEVESSPLDQEFGPGRYDCSGCDQNLFDSNAKFDSRTGWPSFWQPLPDAALTIPDGSFGVSRMAVLCGTCGGHLGHVFDEGPRPTGLRYCMNGAALMFRPSAGH